MVPQGSAGCVPKEVVGLQSVYTSGSAGISVFDPERTGSKQRLTQIDGYCGENHGGCERLANAAKYLRCDH
jgi:hypothetical protein